MASMWPRAASCASRWTPASTRATISFAGPGKSDAELAQAVAAGMLINVESMREIELLAAHRRRAWAAAARGGARQPRLRAEVLGHEDGRRAQAVRHRRRAGARGCSRRSGGCGLAFEGFHIFSGSQNLRAEAICEAQTKALELAVRLAAHAPAPVRSLNLGGGFGIPYFPGEQPLDLAPIGDNLRGVVDERARRAAAGRSWSSSSAATWSARPASTWRASSTARCRAAQVFLVTDGGLHHHLAASGNFGQVIRKNYPVDDRQRVQRRRDRDRHRSSGPLCTPLDLLADRMELAGAPSRATWWWSSSQAPTASPPARTAS